jgi:hypothetical protein
VLLFIFVGANVKSSSGGWNNDRRDSKYGQEVEYPDYDKINRETPIVKNLGYQPHRDIAGLTEDKVEQLRCVV